jgi:RNA polymerase sigma-70 factor (ECF subfamily)
MALPADGFAARLSADANVTPHEALRERPFEEIYEYALPRLYAFLRSQVRSRDVAEELLGRVLIKAYQRWGREPCAEGTVLWLFRAARTTLIDHWRGEGRRERAHVSADELEDVPIAAPDPEVRYAARERQALVLQAISDLHEDDRTLLALKFAGERTNREIAPILGITEAAVSMRLLRAVRALRERLHQLGIA